MFWTLLCSVCRGLRVKTDRIVRKAARRGSGLRQGAPLLRTLCSILHAPCSDRNHRVGEYPGEILTIDHNHFSPPKTPTVHHCRDPEDKQSLLPDSNKLQRDLDKTSGYCPTLFFSLCPSPFLAVVDHLVRLLSSISESLLSLSAYLPTVRPAVPSPGGEGPHISPV